MADVIKKATNKFTKGLVMDFSPENTRNEVLTHALNATLLTFNGNELSLQNDMGNARVETAFLPSGYMPVGTCEYGGIIYIVSYNPLEDKSQIGCFPSPERNISSDELGISEVNIAANMFQTIKAGVPTGDIINTSKYVLLRNDNLNPGDKFLVYADPSMYEEALLDLERQTNNSEFFPVEHPIIALNLVSIEDSGKIVYLNSDLRKYTVERNSVKNKYHLLGETPNSGTLGAIDIDSYRNVLSSGYNVFKSKTSGKLAILAELVTIDSYSVTHSVVPKKIIYDGITQNLEGQYDVIVHTEVEPVITPSNYLLEPKLSYYYLENSQGHLQVADGNINLFTKSGIVNTRFLTTNLLDVYTTIPTKSKNPLNLNNTLQDFGGRFYFPKANTYHGRMEEHSGIISETSTQKVYVKFSEDKFHRVHKSQIGDDTGKHFNPYFANNLQAKFYKYVPGREEYTPFEGTTLNPNYEYFVKVNAFAYHDACRDAAKFKNTGETLYKIEAEVRAANSDIIEDTSIEKFQEVFVYTYLKATESDLEDYETTPLYMQKGNSYEQITGAPKEGTEYYIQILSKPMVSIGFNPDVSQFRGEIYYYPGTKAYIEASENDLRDYWDERTYPLTDKAPWGAPIVLYYRQPSKVFRPATASEMMNFIQDNLTLYYKEDYVLIDYELGGHGNEPIFVVVPMDSYVSLDQFQPNTSYNYIRGCTKPQGDYPKDDPLVMCTVAKFIPNLTTYNGVTTATQYEDMKLAGIKIPGILTANGLDLPFKYSYTLTPCMNYGKLRHLSVSNTVDFSNLHAFEQSNFKDWRYHIDGNQLRLTFSAEIFDTYEQFKADALVLEFYDMWGFAGSLEISGKKSYTGTFTKMLQLNTVGTLSKKRILNGEYNSDFIRNANIEIATEDGKQVYKYKQNALTYSDEVGWIGISEEDNDCGVLYSNLIYGVKTYIRRTTDLGVEFLPKKDCYLFTLPIYNDYYYTITDFNSLTNPKLEMQLTYKLVDSSTKVPYSGNGITDGYNTKDKEAISSFSSIDTPVESFNVTKYYEYSGCSNLYLEVGLREGYKDMNLQYDSSINSIFEYKLQLISDEASDAAFTVKSASTPYLRPKEVLKYSHADGEIPLTVNKLVFKSNNGSTLEGSDLSNRRFISYEGSDPIVLDYSFVVGYFIQVSDIVRKDFPTTTVCALYHETDEGVKNEEDFGIRHATDTSDNKLKYLSKSMVYNSGTRYEKRWGICAQQATAGSITDQVAADTTFTAESTVTSTAGTFNTGADLDKLLPSIGKLTFCMPHTHVITNEWGVNVHGTYYGIPPDYGGMLLHDSSWQEFWGTGTYDDTRGTVPWDQMVKSPRYNMILNTYKSLNYKTEFISTVEYKIASGTKAVYCHGEDGWTSWQYCGTMREFVGLTGAQLASFNEKLLTTMSSVYAYNPDYTTISKLSGKVDIDDLHVQISSNIVNTKSNFKFTQNKTLNDYIYLGSIGVNTYLKNLVAFSNDKFKIYDKDGELIPQLQFIPDITYCGTEASPYVVTSLTYNFIADSSISQDFSSENNNITVRTSDKKYFSLSGKLNTRALYGYDKTTNCLYQLDVSNYIIDSDGNLSCKKPAILKNNSVVGVTVTTNYSKVYNHKYSVLGTYDDGRIRGTSLTLNDLIYEPTSDHRLFVKNGVAVHDPYLRPSLWYGPLARPQSASGNNWSTSWNNTWNDKLDCNYIQLFRGPCFTPDDHNL